MTWLPIETAPKDGSLVLLCNALDGGMYVGFYERSEWEDISGEMMEMLIGEPTHWMPLPEPPR